MYEYRWYKGAPAKTAANMGKCFLLEFISGDRFTVIRCLPEGYIDIESLGIVTDEPVRFHPIQEVTEGQCDT